MRKAASIAQIRRHSALAGLLATAMALVGCSNGEMADLHAFIEETKTKYSGQVEPLPRIVPYESYRYAAAERRDPFRPVAPAVRSVEQSRSNNGVLPNLRRNKETLEQFELDSLKMVGVLENNGETWAAIKAPDKTIYRVRRGNYMGRNHGRITRISETKIQLTEIVPDGIGGWVKRSNTLSLTE